ncbi:hypothetical protein AHAS_Ahas06G0137700 [Arachis hypogaea]
MENREEIEATKHSQSQPQPQVYPHKMNMEEQCAIDVHVSQPPQLEFPLQPWSHHLPQPQVQSQHQPKSQTDISNMMDQFFADTWGYQPPLELIAKVGGHQPLQSQPNLRSGLGRKTKILSRLSPIVSRMLYTSAGRPWLLASLERLWLQSQPNLRSGLGRKTKILSRLSPIVSRMLYTSAGRPWLLASLERLWHRCKSAS